MSRNQRSYKMQTIDDIDDADTIIEGELVDDGMGSIWDNLWSAGQKVVSDTAKVAQGSASEQLDKALRSSQFSAVLDAVEVKAREGVQKEVKAALPTLVVWTVAGGIVGGMVADKGGKIGSTAVIALAMWMGYQLVTKPPEKK